MGKANSIITVMFQLLWTSIILFCIYLIYALLDIVEIDLIAGLGFLTLQPIIGFIFTISTIAICLLIGLPIRLNNKVQTFWLSKPFIPVSGFIFGLFMLMLSFNSNFTTIEDVTVEFHVVQHEIPNLYLSFVGWFLVGFSLLHFYPRSMFNYLKERRLSKPETY